MSDTEKSNNVDLDEELNNGVNEEDIDREIELEIKLERRYETETDAICNFKIAFEKYLYENGMNNITKDLKIRDLNLFLKSLRKK